MNSILEKIVARKREDLARQARWTASPSNRKPLDFLGALTTGREADRVSLIAEVKKASPSKGVIREDFDPVQIARIYESTGAACLSVLTDEPFFQGHLDYLVAIRDAVSIPLLRKDFILEATQVYEAHAMGADAVLLIAECLDADQLKRLHDLICELGMTPLVELYDQRNLDAVLACKPKLVGVNNRDLNTFEVDLQHSIRMKARLPDSVAMVSESGIGNPDDIRLLHQHGVDAVLVGESLMRANDIGQAVRRLLGMSV